MIYGGTLRHSGNRCRARILLGHIYEQDGKEGKGRRQEGVRRGRTLPSAVKRMANVTNHSALCHPALGRIFSSSPRGKENLLVDEEIPAKRAAATLRTGETVLKIGFSVRRGISPRTRSRRNNAAVDAWQQGRV